jgi:hypothetical protein
MLPGMFHCLLHEPGKDEVIARMADFVVSRAAKAAAAVGTLHHTLPLNSPVASD